MPAIEQRPRRSGAPSRAAALLIAGVLGATAPPAQAKVPGATHCYNEICHRVLTLAETAQRVGGMETVVASFYGAPGRDAFNPRAETSSGEIYRPERDDNVASPIYPDGTRLLLWNPATGHAASVRVNNAGPYMSGRTVDASEQLAKRLGFYHQGVARLHAVVIGAPSNDETVFRKGRHYAAVPGYLGRFSNLKLAMLADNYAVMALMQIDDTDAAFASAPQTPGRRAAAIAVAAWQTRVLPAPRAAVAAKPQPARTKVAVAAREIPRRPKLGVPAAAVAPSPAPAVRPEPRESTARCVFERGPACS